jgi:sigma-E factor negative regulatory protein RseB
MIKATRTLSYEGTFVYIQGQALEVMHIAHNGSNGRQRMVSLNGAQREVMVEHDQVICVLPQQQFAFSANNSKRSPFPISLPDELDDLEAQYQFDIVASDRVAGRIAQVVAIKPRDKFRFGYQLWLDDETHLVLRSALIGNDDQLLEQLIFTEIDIRPDIEVIFLGKKPSVMPTAMLNQPDVKGEGSEDVEHSAWKINNLPAGFKQVLHNRYPKGSRQTEHIIFSDGLANVSVFLEALDDTNTALLKGPSRMDATNAFGAMVNKHQAIVVGEVPLVTVQQIAQSIEYMPNDK